MMFSICSCARFFDSFIQSFEDIGIDPISGILLDFRNSLVTIILFPIIKLILYLVLSISLVFIYTRSNI